MPVLFGTGWPYGANVNQRSTKEAKEKIVKPKNVMIITLVPLRVAHLSCYGYHRDTTPNIDRIAAEGTIFECAYSTAAWTPPAHASLLTGLYPSCHGVFGTAGLDDSMPTMGSLLSDTGYRTVGFVSGDVGKHKGLDRGFQEFYFKGDAEGSRAEKLRAVSAVIRRIIRDVRKPVARRLGLTDIRRFAPQVKAKRHSRLTPSRKIKVTRRTTRRVVQWLDAHGRSKQPFFMLVHYKNMHHPYEAPHPYTYRYVSPRAPGVDWRRIRWISTNPHLYMYGNIKATPQDFEVLKALYDAEIHYADKHLGQLFAHMRKLGILDQTLIIILSPHGESFGEHGQNAHCDNLYEPIVHVPLIVRCPGIAPAGLRVRSLVQLTDILPTVLEFVGRGTDGLMLQGHSLLPIEPDRTYREYIIAEREAYFPTFSDSPKNAEQQFERFKRAQRLAQRMICQGDYKYIGEYKFDYGSDGSEYGTSEELFNLATDPDELHNLVAEQPERASAMAARLEQWVGSFEHRTGEPEPERIEEHILEDLRAGGYRI